MDGCMAPGTYVAEDRIVCTQWETIHLILQRLDVIKENGRCEVVLGAWIAGVEVG